MCCHVKTTACTAGVFGEDPPPPPLSALCDDLDFTGHYGLELLWFGLIAMEEYASEFCVGESPAEEDEIFCALKEKLGGLESDFAGGKDYTIFAPNNNALKMFNPEVDGLSTELVVATIYSNHIIRGKQVVPTDLLCYLFVDEMVLFQGTTDSSPVSTGKAPKIHCVDDIRGDTSSFLVGPGNKKKLDNLPRLSRGSEVLSFPFCNGVVYVIDHVIVPKFLKGKIEMINSD